MAAQVNHNLRKRLIFLGYCFCVLFIAIVARSFHLQILSAESLKSKAQKQHTPPLVVFPERGNIYDRNGEKLAFSIMAKSVFADPSKISNPAEAAAKLAPILNLERGYILKRLKQDTRFSWLARKIDLPTVQAVENLKLEGVFLIDEPKRHYPNGELAGQVLGFVGVDNNGLSGLEYKYESQLNGSLEGLVWIRDAKGKKLYPRRERLAGPRDKPLNITLTIDKRVQHIVETQLKEAVVKKNAKGGIALVMDPRTGEVLAMASEPAFNPNLLNRGTKEKSQIKVISESFDPGSTFKPFLAAAAMEEGAAKETDRFFCEKGQYVVADRVIREAQRKSYGSLNLREVMKYSSNIGSVKLVEKLGKDKFYDYVTSFGFGARTGIDLPGETPGILRPAGRWTRVDTATIAFGQGVSVTAIQLLTAMSALANNGELMKPYIVKEVFDNERKNVRQFVPTPLRQVVSPAVAKRITSILTEVVSAPDGTGKNARITNVSVAGKTGTAQKFDTRLRKYSSERVKTSFIGYFPAEKPKIALLVILDEPKKDMWGGLASAPVFSSIGAQILTSLKSDIIEAPAVLDKTKDLSPAIKLRLVASQETLLNSHLLENPVEDNRMPNFRGMTIRDVLKAARQKGIEVKTVGSGWAVHQEPAAGSILGDSPHCRVSFSPGK